MSEAVARRPEMKKYDCDVLVLGGGLPGVCAAIQAGELGLNVILLEKSMTLGGNCGPEIGVHPSDAHRFHPYMVSAGTVGRIIEDAAFYNAKSDSHDMHYNTSLRWDNIMAEALKKAGVKVLRSHYAHTPYVLDNKITAVECEDTLTYKRVKINVTGYIIDDTGDGNISERAGATYRMGREARREFGEALAPENADSITMGASLVAVIRETKQERKFYPPENTPEFYPGYGGDGGITPEKEHSARFYYPSETGGDINVIEDAHEIYERIVGHLNSAWDRHKNDVSRDELKNWEMGFVSAKLAKRESRRFNGDYMINENDIDDGRIFEDAIAVGGFATDIHYPKEGHPEYVAVIYHRIPPVYTIPYRSIYSKDVDNLFFASRLLSASHIAHGSIRVQRTLSQIGQAAGAAAYICKKYGISPRELYTENHIEELKQLLIKYDATIPGAVNEDPLDKARFAQISASSEIDSIFEGDCEFIKVNGISGAELWNFKNEINEAFIHIKNEGNEKIKAKLKISRFTPEHKWQKHGEREFFDFYKYHNETEWGSETRLDLYKDIKEVPFEIEGLFEGVLKIPVNVKLDSEKYFLSDDDKLAITIETESDKLFIAVKDELSPFIRFIEKVTDAEKGKKYKVLPKTPFIYVSPETSLGKAENILNGVNRRFSENPLNMWVPKELPSFVTLKWNEKIKADEIRITFDTLERLSHDMPYECGKRASGQCVKSFKIELMKGNETVKVIEENMNYHRLYVKNIEEVKFDTLKLTLLETWEENRLPGIYEIRVY